MTKKEYIIYILGSLEDIWEEAKGLKLKLQKLDESNKQVFDDFFDILKESISKIEDKKVSERLQKNISNIKNNEVYDTQKDNKELLMLEKELDNIT